MVKVDDNKTNLKNNQIIIIIITIIITMETHNAPWVSTGDHGQSRTKSGRGGGGCPKLDKGPGAAQVPGEVQGPRPAGGSGGKK